MGKSGLEWSSMYHVYLIRCGEIRIKFAFEVQR